MGCDRVRRLSRIKRGQSLHSSTLASFPSTASGLYRLSADGEIDQARHGVSRASIAVCSDRALPRECLCVVCKVIIFEQSTTAFDFSCPGVVTSNNTGDVSNT